MQNGENQSELTGAGGEMAFPEYEVLFDPISFGVPIHMAQQNTTCQVEIPVSASAGFSNAGDFCQPFTSPSVEEVSLCPKVNPVTFP